MNIHGLVILGILLSSFLTYTPLGPGPGFFPFWLSLCLAALAVAMFYQATCKEAAPRPADFIDSRVGYLRAFTMCAAWIWATVMLERLGYRLTMLVFFPLLLLSLRRVKGFLVILISILGSVVAYYVFSIFLSVPLPVGPLTGFSSRSTTFRTSRVRMFAWKPSNR